MVINFILCFAAFLFGLLGAWAVSSFAEQLCLIDKPSERSSHSCPTPKGGGLGILLAFLFFSGFFDLALGSVWGVTLLALISLRGDRQDLSPKFRLLIQFLCAGLGLWGLGFEVHLSFTLFVLLMPVILIFIVGTANFYNFMDGINGLAGISGVIAFAGLAFWGHSLGRIDISMVSMALATSCAGFLPLNIPRAKVFMGDVGSILLGFCFALFVLALSASILDFFVLSSLLLTFYSDEISTMILRKHQGESLVKPHRKHLYQVLANELGIAHWKISAGYGLVQILGFVFIWGLSLYGLGAVLGGLFVFAVFWYVVDNKIKHKAWGHN